VSSPADFRDHTHADQLQNVPARATGRHKSGVREGGPNRDPRFFFSTPSPTHRPIEVTRNPTFLDCPGVGHLAPWSLTLPKPRVLIKRKNFAARRQKRRPALSLRLA